MLNCHILISPNLALFEKGLDTTAPDERHEKIWSQISRFKTTPCSGNLGPSQGSDGAQEQAAVDLI